MGQPITSWGGGWRTCSECGKEFFVNDLPKWAYKINTSYVRHKGKTHYFCKWSCMRKFSDRYEEEKHERRVKAALNNKRPRKPARLCFECACNLVDEKTGKHYCSLNLERYVFPKKDACGLFVEKGGESA